MANIMRYTGSGKNILLWENASPTASFPAQTITLPQGFKQFVVCWGRYASSTTTIRKTFVNFSNDYQTMTDGIYAREITNAQDGTISFGNALTPKIGQSASGLIPLKIYGVKHEI